MWTRIALALLITSPLAVFSQEKPTQEKPDPHAGHHSSAPAAAQPAATAAARAAPLPPPPAAPNPAAPAAARDESLPPSEQQAKAALEMSPRHGEWVDVKLPSGGTPTRTRTAAPGRQEKAGRGAAAPS